MTVHADPERAACAGLPDIFTSPHMFDHRIAVRYCLGDGDRPACPLFEKCAADTPEASANADGTYAAVLFRNGKQIAKHGKVLGRDAVA